MISMRRGLGAGACAAGQHARHASMCVHRQQVRLCDAFLDIGDGGQSCLLTSAQHGAHLEELPTQRELEPGEECC